MGYKVVYPENVVNIDALFNEKEFEKVVELGQNFFRSFLVNFEIVPCK